MRAASLVLLLSVAALSACRPPVPVVASGAVCDGSAARAVSHTGTLHVVWGAGTRFYVRAGERTLELLIDRPERVSSDILQGLSSRTVQVDGRESNGAAKICADQVTIVEASLR